MYTSFAEVYDQLMDDVNYERWADLYREILTSCGIVWARSASVPAAPAG